LAAERAVANVTSVAGFTHQRVIIYMTKVLTTDSIGLRDGLADEIEITKEMIEAGKWALVTHDPEHFSMDEIVSSVWSAMVLARPSEELRPSHQKRFPKGS
jgi:hypothetical protein